jgi:nucleotide-binding universal stress UspA family protein
MKRILVAVDTSRNAELVVARAVEVARGMGGRLRLLHVVSTPVPPPPPPGGFAAPPLSTPHLVAAAESFVDRLLDAVPEELRDGAVVGVGAPSEIICAIARSHDVDLVVIGAHEHGLVARMLGTTAARIVDRIDRSVLVVRRS